MYQNKADIRTDISAIDLFCGAGGLSQGLLDAGITVVGGIDLDEECKYPFEANIGAPFLAKDVTQVTSKDLHALWGDSQIRLLAGCAPCQPFSRHRRSFVPTDDERWSLLQSFERLIEETLPELVTMENVPGLERESVFSDFVDTLRRLNYSVDWRRCYGPDYGLAQSRRRLVLVASQLGDITAPAPTNDRTEHPTVRQVIGDLPSLVSGATDTNDRLHKARDLSPKNIQRIKASKPGGTWEDWPSELWLDCHKKSSGKSFKSVYGRMHWDDIAPTITTQSFNLGTGRFGHPEQDRAITLREAAMLQSFPASYQFTAPDTPLHFTKVGRMIGNAVPPLLGKSIGKEFVKHLESTSIHSEENQS